MGEREKRRGRKKGDLLPPPHVVLTTFNSLYLYLSICTWCFWLFLLLQYCPICLAHSVFVQLFLSAGEVSFVPLSLAVIDLFSAPYLGYGTWTEQPQVQWSVGFIPAPLEASHNARRCLAHLVISGVLSQWSAHGVCWGTGTAWANFTYGDSFQGVVRWTGAMGISREPDLGWITEYAPRICTSLVLRKECSYYTEVTSVGVCGEREQSCLMFCPNWS